MPSQFENQVIELAGLCGWLRAHFRPAKTTKGWRTPVSGDGKGFPDLILLRPPRLIVAELKTGRDTPNKDQANWLNHFYGSSFDTEVYVWYPEHWEFIKFTLDKDGMVQFGDWDLDKFKRSPFWEHWKEFNQTLYGSR